MWPILPKEVTGEDVSPLPLNVRSTALASSILVKTGQGALVGFTVYNNKSASQFIQVFDVGSAPASGAVPDCVFIVAQTANLPVQWVPWRVFRVGCFICNSSTAATLTAGSADCYFDVQYI